METLFGRKRFDEKDYQQNDPVGKAKALKILSHTKLYKSGAYKILNPYEDKKCGDVKIQYTHDNSIIEYEIENAGFDRFDINFNSGYSHVNVPMKKFHLIPNGFFMAVDGGESIDIEIPERFYLIEVRHILEAITAANVNKKSDGKKEKFYKIPTHLVKRYIWNDEKGKYNEFKPKHNNYSKSSRSSSGYLFAN